MCDDYPELWQQARTCLARGDCRHAIPFFERAALQNDDDPDLHEAWGTALFLLGEYDGAIARFQRVLDLAPRHAAALVNLGAVYNRMGKYPLAITVLRKGVQIDRKSAIGYYNLGIAYRQQKQWAMAVPAYREAIRLNPAMVDAYFNLGNVFLEMGNFQQAVAQYKRALEINPRFTKARAAWEQAEATRKANKAAENPFGRLVTAKVLARPQVSDTPEVHLSDAARVADRQTLVQLTGELETTARHLVEMLREGFEPALHELDKLLTQEEGVPSSVKQVAADDFRAACETLQSLMADLRKPMNRLHNHEQELAAESGE
jgi:tetratricopeptide (TPR) repeat protein